MLFVAGTVGDGLWDPAEWTLAEAVRRDDDGSKPLLEVIDEIPDGQGANDSESEEENGSESDTVSNDSGSDMGDYEESDYDIEEDDDDESADVGYPDPSDRMFERFVSYKLK